MNILEELSGIEQSDLQVTYGTTFNMFDFQKLYLTGYKKIISISSEKIELKLKNVVCEISGEDLIVSYLGKNEILINGFIMGIQNR